nr:16S rRNA (guanine(527)-N(7))-methyltransferase RsmG [Acidisoma sp.]
MAASLESHAGQSPSPALPPQLRDKLAVYAELLTRWNRTIRLVSTQDVPAIWTRHVMDSLQLLPFLPPGLAGAIDLGSGGGLPGLVLALASDVHFDLIEADARKAAFLKEAAQATGAPVTIHAQRIEAVSLPPSGFVTARALAPLPKLLSLAAPLLAPGGLCLFPKGQSFDAEIDDARHSWTMTIETMPSRTSPEGRLLLIRDLRQKDTGR